MFETERGFTLKLFAATAVCNGSLVHEIIKSIDASSHVFVFIVLGLRNRECKKLVRNGFNDTFKMKVTYYIK